MRTLKAQLSPHVFMYLRCTNITKSDDGRNSMNKDSSNSYTAMSSRMRAHRRNSKGKSDRS